MIACFFEATPPRIRFESFAVSTFSFSTFNLFTLILFPFVLFFVVAMSFSLSVQNSLADEIRFSHPSPLAGKDCGRASSYPLNAYKTEMICFFEATPPLIRFESLVVSTFCFPTFNLLTLTLFPFVLFFVVAMSFSFLCRAPWLMNTTK